MKYHKAYARPFDASMRTMLMYGAGTALALLGVRACLPTWWMLQQVCAFLTNLLTLLFVIAVFALIGLVALDSGRRAAFWVRKRWRLWWSDAVDALPRPDEPITAPTSGIWDVPAMLAAHHPVRADPGMAECLPIVETRIVVSMLDPDPDVVPLVFVDVRHRPDVADLPRVQMSEGRGEMTTTWAVLEIPTRAAMVELMCSYHRPVKTQFRVRFPLREKAAFVESISMTGQLGIVPCVGNQVALGATRLLVETVPFTGIAVDARTAQEIGEWVTEWRSAGEKGGES
jgi:hypothetical protein